MRVSCLPLFNLCLLQRPTSGWWQHLEEHYISLCWNSSSYSCLESDTTVDDLYKATQTGIPVPPPPYLPKACSQASRSLLSAGRRVCAATGKQTVVLIQTKPNTLPSSPSLLLFLPGYFFSLGSPSAPQMLVQGQRKGRRKQLRDSGRLHWTQCDLRTTDSTSTGNTEVVSS